VVAIVHLPAKVITVTDHEFARQADRTANLGVIELRLIDLQLPD
jgi:hypothetical protein